MENTNSQSHDEQLARERRQFSMNNVLLSFGFVIIIVLLVAASGFIFYSPRPQPFVGNVEIEEVRISGKVPGRIHQIMVEEGQYVQKGDTLVKIYTPEVIAKEQQAQAAEDAAIAMQKKADAGTRAELKQGAFEMWQKANAGLMVAEKTYNRVKKLYAEGVLPSQKMDEAEAQYNAMVATERAAYSQYQMALNGAQIEDKMAARALVDKAKGAINEVSAYMAEGALTSPINGQISDIFPRVGELVGSGAPIMMVADTSKVKVLFNVREDYLSKVKIGAIFHVYIPALNNLKTDIKVTRIKDFGTFATWKATKPTGEIDLRTFEVTAKFVKHIPNLVSGMSIVLENGQLTQTKE